MDIKEVRDVFADAIHFFAQCTGIPIVDEECGEVRIICYFLDNRQILNAPEIRRVQEYAVFGIQRTYAGDADGEEGAMVARL